MSISKIRKNLWAKSGNRCAICKTELFSKDESSDEYNIGEECHIISSKKNGPRYKPNLDDYDTFDNLLLLCRNDHKMVDELVESYTEEILRYMKQSHEVWVNNTLNDELISNKEDKLKFLTRITSGKELFNIIFDSDGYRMDYDNVNTDEEADYIGGVLQIISDCGDISANFEVQDKVKVGLELNIILEELNEKGYMLFGESRFEDYRGIKNFSIATLVIKKQDSDDVIKVDLEEYESLDNV